MKIFTLEKIKSIIQSIDIIPIIEQGFIAYSAGRCVIPPIGELIFDKPPGDVHIKYGYIKDDNYYVIKIASGFYENPKLGLSSSNGLMLLFDQKTGQLLSILLDEGYLTNIRTAAAGAIAAKYLAPQFVHTIGIIGTGMQAKLQLLFLKRVTDCKAVIVWGRSQTSLDNYTADLATKDFQIRTTTHIAEVASNCNLIVTTTPATQALLLNKDIQLGTHITAIGSDTPNKQELETHILERADIVVTDSLAQCKQRGEIAHALKKGKLQENKIIELGNLIAHGIFPRQSEKQITIADLTGVAVQDIQIAKAVYDYSSDFINRN